MKEKSLSDVGVALSSCEEIASWMAVGADCIYLFFFRMRQEESPGVFGLEASEEKQKNKCECK